MMFDLEDFVSDLESLVSHLQDATRPGSRIVSHGPVEGERRFYITVHHKDSYETFAVEHVIDGFRDFERWLANLPLTALEGPDA